MARFLVDAQLPPGLARRLRDRGHEAVHIFEITRPNAPDREIAQLAISRAAILVSKDEDFVSRASLGELNCRVLWIRVGNTTNEFLWARVASHLDQAIEMFEQGDVIVEIA